MGMKDLERALTDAWFRIRPVLRKDPDELARRLARRRTPLLMRPPRAWCLGVRAGDTRITPMHAYLAPTHAVDRLHPSHRGKVLPHTVRLEPHILKKLMGPVDLTLWRGHTAREAARKLGRGDRLMYHRKKGTLICDKIQGLGGARCAIPLVQMREDRLADPNHGANFQPPDACWGTLWQYLADYVPDDFAQAVTREPVYRNYRGRLYFSGWRWICPACRAPTRMIFYPVPVPTIVDYLGEEKRFVRSDADEVQAPVPAFACHDCHQIRYWSSTIHSSWNHLVAYLSGGLLYGREVQRPAWFVAQRKRPHRPHPLPMVRGEEVEQHLLAGLTYEQTAKEMNIKLATVQGHVRRLYKKRGVHSRAQLITHANARAATSAVAAPLATRKVG